MNFIPTFYPKVKCLIIFARLLSRSCAECTAISVSCVNKNRRKVANITPCGWSLRPEVSALLMSASSIIVAVNAVMLRRSQKQLLAG